MTDLHHQMAGSFLDLVKTCLHREYEATENTESEYICQRTESFEGGV